MDVVTPAFRSHSDEEMFFAKLGSKSLGYDRLPRIGTRKWQTALEIGVSQAKLTKIAKCGLNDLEKIYEIEVLCFDERFRYSKANYDELLNSSDVDSLKISIGEEILAYVFWFNSTHEIITLNVHPKYRRLGIASLILRTLETTIKKPTVLTLEVYEKNYPAIRMYKESGFRVDSVIVDYYGKGSNAILMKKKFSYRNTKRIESANKV